EAAELLDTTVAAINSALQRARATLASVHADGRGPEAVDAGQRELLARYVDAFERYDVATLVTLLRDDAVQSMPPYAMWIQGAENIGRWLQGPGYGCKGSRMLTTAANGCAAFGQYRSDGHGGHSPWAIQVIEVSGGRISGFHSFLDTDLFAAFGLPDRLPAQLPT
ncbi:MAG: nuclear transport factor 2 family protein, partial [Actinomycetes bacterium]